MEDESSLGVFVVATRAGGAIFGTVINVHSVCKVSSFSGDSDHERSAVLHD